MAKHFNYAVYQERLQNLKEKTLRLMKESDNSELASQMESELNSANECKELKLAFVGQYSSGKSTIISALTGRKDIKIDANVATDKVSKYEWNNIILMDTPGILAGKVETHDEETKNALRECDLIFYVLTSQLFDDVVFNNFIDLAYNQHFADKMFVIINKMGMESGEYDQLASNYMLSLEKTFSVRGYNIHDFPIAFIDASDYLEGIDEGDDEFVQLSHFEHFIEMLNTFVSQKGVIKKQFDTPVRVLHSYLKNIEVSAVDKTLSEFYNQFEQKLGHSQAEVKRDVLNILYNFGSSTMAEVIRLSNEIGYTEEGEWKSKQESLNDNLKTIISDTSSQIESSINDNYEKLLSEVSNFSEKDSLQKYSQELDDKVNAPNISIEERKNLMVQKKCLELLKQGGTKVSGMAPGVDSFFGGVSNASGSQLHSIVKNVGHFFGKKFRPWEATRWASNIAKFAKFGIPVITAGIDIWMQFREESKEDRRLEQIKESKNQFVTGYQSEINKVKSQFEQYLYKVLENYANKRNEINASKAEVIRAAKRNDEMTRSIEQLEGEYVDFIEIINQDNQ